MTSDTTRMKNPTLKRALMADLLQTVGILPILILIVAVICSVAPNLIPEANLLNITRQASIKIVLAAGMTFVILTGGIDLSVGSMLGTTAVVAMVVSLDPAFASLTIPAALGAGLIMGLFNGLLVAWAGLPPFIVTLGIVVDDAIIVGENVYHHHQNGAPWFDAAVSGTREICMPVTFTVLTNMVAFAPLFLVPGILGKVFKQIPVVVIAVFAVSLIVWLVASLATTLQQRFCPFCSPAVRSAAGDGFTLAICDRVLGYRCFVDYNGLREERKNGVRAFS